MNEKLLTLARSSLLLMLFLLTSAFANATDFVDIDLGKEYSAAVKVTWYGKWTAPSNGTFTMSTGEKTDVYTDESMTQAVNKTKTYSKTYFTATAGVTYYMKAGGGINAITFTCSFEAEGEGTVNMVSVSPEEGSTLQCAGLGFISLEFDKIITLDGAVMTHGGNSVALEATAKTTGPYASVIYKTKLYEWLVNGTVNEGDDITITISGIASSSDSSVKYGEDGTLTLNYKAGKVPMGLVSATMPEKFLSKWESGDETGVASMKFSQKISTTATPTATISCGSKDKDADGGYYQETVPVTIGSDGMSLTIDFTGKSRTYTDMFPNYDVETALADESLASYFQNVSLKVANIMDTDSVYCYTSSTAHTGSFSYSIPYESTTTTSVTISSEFNPASGESLAYIDQIGIYFDNASYVEWTGVNYTYDGTDGQVTETVNKDACTIIEEDGDAIEIHAPVPEAVKTAKNVVVTLAGITYKEGATGTITAQYNLSGDEDEAFSVTMLSPDPTETWATLNAGDTIKVKPTHFDEIGYMSYEIRDAATGESVKAYSENLEKDADTQTVSYEVFGDYTFYEGHTYNIIFDAWPSGADKRAGTNHIGTDTISITGSSEEYKFSTVKFVSIDPEESSSYVIDSSDKNTFVLTFDGLVYVDPSQTNIHDASGTSLSFESITATGTDAETVDGKNYSTVWKLVVPASYIESSDVTAVGFGVKAYDKDGLLVEGNTGEKANSYLYFEYACCAGVPDFTIDPVGGSTVTSLKEFTVSYSEGICASWLVDKNKIRLLDASGNVVASATSTEQIIPDEEADNWSYVPTSVKVILSTEITASGEYTLSFPYKYFMLGQDMSAQNSKPQSFKYTIAGSSTGATANLIPSATDPAEGTVTSIEAIHLTFGEDVVVNNSLTTSPVTVVASDGTTYTGTINYYVDPLDTKSVYVELDPAITAEGTYTITIAEGTIGNSEYGSSNYTSGSCNPALTFTYTVGAATVQYPVTADPADGSTVSSLSKITLTWEGISDAADSYDYSLPIQVSKDGEVIATVRELGFADDWNVLVLNLSEEITAAGTYTITIPAGRVLFNEGAVTSPDTYTLTYTVDGTLDGISSIVCDENGRYNVYTVSGIRVKSTNSGAELKTLKPGLYIINGKKVAVK